MMIDAKNHTATIIYEPYYEDVEGRTMYGDTETFGFGHANAIDNIEAKMAVFDWPPISSKKRLSQEKAMIHTLYGNIVILNYGFDNEHPNLCIYLPNNLDNNKDKIIKNYITDNIEFIDGIVICRGYSNDKFDFDEYEKQDINSFLQSKTKHFTINRQNSKNNQ